MKNDFNNGKLTEDRLERKRKKKNARLESILVMFGCLVVLVLVMYIAGALYGWIDDRFQENANDMAAAAGMSDETAEVVTYTQDELDAQVAEAVEAARTQALQEKSDEILNGIKGQLTEGTTMVETLRPYYPNELVVVSSGTFHFVPIDPNLKKNAYLEENRIILENGEYQYQENGQVVSHKGIDVSKHQGKIDWTKVAEDGVEFAFIRVGLRGYGTGKIVEDEYFESNIKGAISAGIKVGVYFYSQAISQEEIDEEAAFVLEKIAPYKVECPVVFDVEKVLDSSGRMNALTVEERTNLTLSFCQTIENAGYTPMIYHNMEMGALMLDLETLENYGKWFAYYNPDLYYPYDYKIWQYSDEGIVNGINGNVDLNISFGPIWAE